jgi:hypothetical protein
VCHGIPHRLPRCDASITIAGLLVVIGPVAWLGLGLIDGLEMLLARLRSGKLVPPPSQAIKDWPFIGQQLYDFWLLASTNARSAAAATAARWAILAEYGEQRRHLDAEFSRLRNHRGLFVFSWAAARHNGKDPRTETRLEARQRVCGNCRGDDSHGIAGVIGVSLLQSVVGGIGMVFAGVPGASLLALAILVLGIVQIGSLIIVAPLIVWSWLTLTTGIAWPSRLACRSSSSWKIS